MKRPQITSNEAERLKTLQELNILDTGLEESYNSLSAGIDHTSF